MSNQRKIYSILISAAFPAIAFFGLLLMISYGMAQVPAFSENMNVADTPENMGVPNAPTPPQNQDTERVYDPTTKTLHVKNKGTGKNTLIIQQISSAPELTTFTETFKITSEEPYIFNNGKDFQARWQKHLGNNDITNAEWFQQVDTTTTTTIYEKGWYNQTIDTGQVKTEEVGSRLGKRYLWGENETVTKRVYGVVGTRTETKFEKTWLPLDLHGKTIQPGEEIYVQVVFKKKAENSSFAIQTIPKFAGVEAPEMSWWNSTWITRIDNALANSRRPYSYMLNVSNSTGTNNATHVFVNCQAANCQDIRFTLDNTTQLSHWFETFPTADGTWGRVWVNVTANGSVNLYYGNPDATYNNTAGGQNTFELFDDWNGIDANWTVYAGSPSVSGGILTVPSGAKIYSNRVFGTGWAISWNASAASTNYAYIGFGEYTDVQYLVGFYTHYTTTNVHNAVSRSSPGVHTFTNMGAQSGYKILTAKRNAATDARFSVNYGADSVISSTLYTGNAPAFVWGQSEQVLSDWVFVRPYINPEPTWGTWSGEKGESPGAIPPAPVSLTNTTGSTWIQFSWSAGTGNVTDSYNVSANGTWVNGTAAPYNSTIAPHGSLSINVYAYNSSGNGNLSAASISDSVSLPNNPPVIGNISESYTMANGMNLTIFPTATDVDGDSITWSSDATIGAFYTGNGTYFLQGYTGGNYTFYIQAADGYSSSRVNFSIVESGKLRYTCTMSGENKILNPCYVSFGIANNTLVNGTYQLEFNITNAMLGGQTRADFADLRFRKNMNTSAIYFNATTTYYNYWVQEKLNGSWVRGYVNIDSNVSSISIEFGNHSLSSASNGQGTFPLFDDFNGRTTLNSTLAYTQTTIIDHDNEPDVDNQFGIGQAITQINGSSLIAVYRHAKQEGDMYGYIDYKISNDSGLTWSDNMTWIDTEYPHDDIAPALTTTQNGTIVGLITFSNIISQGDPIGDGMGVKALRSTDGGVTWNITTVIPKSGNLTILGYGLQTMPNGNLFAPLMVYNYGEQRALISTDDGQTWTNNFVYNHGTSPNPPYSGYGIYSDFSCAPYEDGRVICLEREEAGANIGFLKNTNNGTGAWTFGTISKIIEITPSIERIGSDMFITVSRVEGVQLRRIDADLFWNDPGTAFESGMNYSTFTLSDPATTDAGMQSMAWLNDSLYIISYESWSQAGDVLLSRVNISDVGKTAWWLREGTNYTVSGGELKISGGSANTVIENPNLWQYDVAIGARWKTVPQANTQFQLNKNTPMDYTDALGIFANYSSTYAAPQDRMTVINSQSAGIGGIANFTNYAKNTSDYTTYEALWNRTVVSFLHNDTVDATNTSGIPDAPLNLSVRAAAGNTVDYDAFDWVYLRRYITPEPTINYTSSLNVNYHEPVLTNTSNITVNEAETVSIDFGCTDGDGDSCTFSINRTDLFADFSVAAGTSTWRTGYDSNGTYALAVGASDGYGGIDNVTMIITVDNITAIPPVPISLTSTTGTNWINHSWSAGSGNVTDSYNVNVNGTWTNHTTATFSNTSDLDELDWANITVYAYNITGGESITAASKNTQLTTASVSTTPRTVNSGGNGGSGGRDGTQPGTPNPENKIYSFRVHLEGESGRLVIPGNAKTGESPPVSALNLYFKIPYRGDYTIIIGVYSDYETPLEGAEQYFSISPNFELTPESSMEIKSNKAIDIYQLYTTGWQKLPSPRKISSDTYQFSISSLGVFAIVDAGLQRETGAQIQKTKSSFEMKLIKNWVLNDWKNIDWKLLAHNVSEYVQKKDWELYNALHDYFDPHIQSVSRIIGGFLG